MSEEMRAPHGIETRLPHHPATKKENEPTKVQLSFPCRDPNNSHNTIIMYGAKIEATQ